MTAIDPRGEVVTAIEMAGAFVFGGVVINDDGRRPHVIVCASGSRYVVPLSSFRQTFTIIRDDVETLIAMLAAREAEVVR